MRLRKMGDEKDARDTGEKDEVIWVAADDLELAGLNKTWKLRN